MKISVFDISGKALTPWEFDPKTLGGENQALLAQALRVYESNSHQKTHKVKTRGEVSGSTRKIYRQKGTGKARHGAKYAPIFVGGGIAHGPTGIRPENLVLPKAMRRRSLAAALHSKLKDQELAGFKGASKVSGKTSSAAKFLTVAAGHPQASVLVITAGRASALYQTVQNLQGVTMKRASLVNAYDLVGSDRVILTKKALDSLLARIKS